MAYCVQCGKQVADADKFCPGCGRPQNSNASRQDAANFWANVTDQNAAMFCYVPWVGWIAAVAVLASDHFRGNRRLHFHAFQGLYLFVTWLLVENFASPMLRFGTGYPGRSLTGLLTLAVIGAWVFMMVKVRQNEDYRLPILGELADRSVSEQRS